MTAVGTRVFAVQSADEDKVVGWGTGIYLGDRPCPVKAEMLGGIESIRDEVIARITEDDSKPPKETSTWRMFEFVKAMHEQHGQDMKEIPTEEEILEMIQELRSGGLWVRVIHEMRMMLENPCILLDTGMVVWGMESWWGPETRMEETIAGRKVELIAGREPRVETAVHEPFLVGGDPDNMRIEGTRKKQATCGHMVSLSPSSISLLDHTPDLEVICGDCCLSDVERLKDMMFNSTLKMTPEQREELEKADPKAMEHLEGALGMEMLTEDDYDGMVK